MEKRDFHIIAETGIHAQSLVQTLTWNTMVSQ